MMDTDKFFRRPTVAAAGYVASNLRGCDRNELRASYGDDADFRRIVFKALAISNLAWIWYAPDDEPMAAVGVAPLSLMSGIGSPWFLGTERVFEYPLVFVRQGRILTRRMQAAYPHLINFIHRDNQTSIEWLERVGYTVGAPEPYGVRGEMFRRFEKHPRVHLTDTGTDTLDG